MSSNIIYDINTVNGNNIARVKNLGYDSYTASDRRYEPQTQNTFAFQFLFTPGQVAYIATSANEHFSPVVGNREIPTSHAAGLKEINEVLNSSMQSIGSPTKNVATIMIDFFNSQVKFAGKPTYSNANITFNTFIGLGTKNILSAWSDLCLNDNTSAGGWARDLPNYIVPQRGTKDATTYLNELFPNIGYKCDGMLLECARDGSIVNQWDYIGMWVSSFTPGNYNMGGSSSASQVSTTITVDLIKPSTSTYKSL